MHTHLFVHAFSVLPRPPLSFGVSYLPACLPACLSTCRGSVSTGSHCAEKDQDDDEHQHQHEHEPEPGLWAPKS